MNVRTVMRCFRLLMVTLAFCWLSAVHAQTSIMIWPLDPVIEDDQRAAALWLENRGNQPASLQIRILAWTQAGGEERYDPQEAVVASPPAATIQPGQRQLVRLMKTQGAPDGQEWAYRILVDELPPVTGTVEPRAGDSAMGIKLQIRYSVPLFVSGKGHWLKPRADKRRDPASAAQTVLSWRTERQGNDHFLWVRNTGNAHARLTAVQWQKGEQTQTINAGLIGYALAGTQMRWRLEAPPPPGFSLQARVNGGEAPATLAPQ